MDVIRGDMMGIGNQYDENLVIVVENGGLYILDLVCHFIQLILLCYCRRCLVQVRNLKVTDGGGVEGFLPGRMRNWMNVVKFGLIFFLQDNIPYGRGQQLDLGVGYPIKYVHQRLTHVVVEKPFSLNILCGIRKFHCKHLCLHVDFRTIEFQLKIICCVVEFCMIVSIFASKIAGLTNLLIIYIFIVIGLVMFGSSFETGSSFLVFFPFMPLITPLGFMIWLWALKCFNMVLI